MDVVDHDWKIGGGLSDAAAAAITGAAGAAAGTVFRKFSGAAKRGPHLRGTATLDPQTLHKKRRGHANKRLMPGQQHLEPHAELVESPLKYRLKSSYPQDMIHQFFRNFTSARNFHSQFAFQCVGEQQVRGIFGMIFRHNAGDAEQAGFGSQVYNNGRLLLAKPTFGKPTVGDAASVTYATDLPYNYLNWRDRYHHQGKVFLAGTSMGDFEDMVSQITPHWMQPFNASQSYAGNLPSNIGDFIMAQDASQNNPTPIIPYDASAQGVNRAYGKWVEGYKKEREESTQEAWDTSNVQRPPRRFVCFRDGGVNLHFENKHPMGAFVEVMVYTIKKQMLANVIIQADANQLEPDNWMKQIFEDCGKNYLNKTAGQSYFQGAETLEGRVPSKEDVTTNPYYPLLPKGGESDSFSERERIKFALASGHKRSVNLKFGGLNYDPADQLAHQVTFQNVTQNPYNVPTHAHAVMVVVAVNGQLVSVAATALSTGENLTSGNAAAGTNMIIKGDYYEQFYPMKVVMPTKYDALGNQDYEIPNSTSQMRYEPYTIVDAANVIRGVSNDVSSGHAINPNNNTTDQI